MKTNAYTIYDRKGLLYHQPFFAVTDGAATRMVADLVRDNNTTIGRHPTDYVLFCCGEYDDQLGSLLPKSPLSHVIDCSALVEQQSGLFPDAAAPVVNLNAGRK